MQALPHLTDLDLSPVQLGPFVIVASGKIQPHFEGRKTDKDDKDRTGHRKEKGGMFPKTLGVEAVIGWGGGTFREPHLVGKGWSVGFCSLLCWLASLRT